ncbi:MAG: hypothetical protein RIQ33_2430 [Bacteroidota bacterium]|jgi:uncharacterized protein YciI
MNQFIYFLSLLPEKRKEVFSDDENAIIVNHFNYLLNAKEEGKIILVGRTQLSTSDIKNKGICIFTIENETEAIEFMNNDPAIKCGMMLGELFPFKVAIG